MPEAEDQNSARDHDKIDLDAATLRSLSLITVGRPLDFVDLEEPPGTLRGANLRQVQGLLAETLRRWHELRQR